MNETSIIRFKVTGHYGDSPDNPNYTELYVASVAFSSKINLMICAQEMTDVFARSGGFEGCMDDLEVEAQRMRLYSDMLQGLASFIPDVTEGSMLFSYHFTSETAYVVNFRIYAE